jgi:molecular chaperone GrpE
MTGSRTSDDGPGSGDESGDADSTERTQAGSSRSRSRPADHEHGRSRGRSGEHEQSGGDADLNREGFEEPVQAKHLEQVEDLGQAEGLKHVNHAQEVEDLEQALEAARRERDEYLDVLRHVQADFENYKKRMIRQQTDLLERASQGLVEKLLPALDAFELAREHLSDAQDLSDEGKALLQASSLLVDTLAKEGLELISDVGATFDPTAHEAVEHVETEQAPAGQASAERRGQGHGAHPHEAAGREAMRQQAADQKTARWGGGAAPSGGSAVDAASATSEGAATEPVVVGVLRPGYRWKGRLIRPAMVRVRG